MMHLLEVNPFYYPYSGGIENVLYELNKRLAKNHDISVLTSRWPGEKRHEEIDGVHVHRMDSFVFKKMPSLFPPPFSINFFPSCHMVRRIMHDKPDVIHLHNRFFPTLHPIAFWKRAFRKPLFLTIHNPRPTNINAQTDFFGALYDNTLGGIIIRSADYVTGVSQHALDITCPGVPADKKRVIYNGIDTKRYKPVKNDVHDEFGADHIILTTSRHQPQKGLDTFIQSLKQLDGDWHAVIASDGPERRNLESLASRLGLSKRVTFTGRVSNERLRELYSGADAYVLPSTYEAFGVVLLEAMCTGVPVVATKVGGIPEVMGDTGIMVEPRDADGMTRELQALINSPKMRSDIVKAQSERVKLFDWDVIAAQYERCYADYLEARK